MMSEGVVGGLLFPIYLGVPITPAPLPLMLVCDLRSKKSIQ